MHCIAKQVGVGRSLASGDKFLKFVGTIKENEKRSGGGGSLGGLLTQAKKVRMASLQKATQHIFTSKI